MNNALITKTLIFNSGSIIDEPKSFSLDKFFDLSAFCEASILFDELKHIKASHELQPFSLTEELKVERIMNEFKPEISREEYNNFLQQLPDFTNGSHNLPEALSDDKYSSSFMQLRHLNPSGIQNSNILFAKDLDQSMEILLSSEPEWFYGGENCHSLYYALLHNLPGSQESYLKRSIGYLIASYYYKIDYFPDYIRVPHLINYINKMYKSIPLELYKGMSKKLSMDEKEIDSSIKSVTFPIPPLTKIILSESHRLEDIPSTIINIRKDFSSFRREISQLDAKLKNQVSTIEERKEILIRKKCLFEEISKEHSSEDLITFKPLMNLFDPLVKILAKPTDPTSYSAAILSQPVEWIRRWWLRRPLTPLFRVDSKVRKIRNYDLLIGKLWGYEKQKYLSSNYIEHSSKYIEHSSLINSIFDKY